MFFMDFMFFILVGVGITNLVVNGGIFEGFRKVVTEQSDFLGQAISCMMCFGFWVGCCMALFEPQINVLYGGALISLASYVFTSIIGYIDLQTVLGSQKIDTDYVEEEDERYERD